MKYLLIVVAVLFTCGAVAQTPPAGNAHPETHNVSDVHADLANPFGAVDWGAAMRPDPDQRGTAEKKAAFASAVDLSPLRKLAVFHNGRVKILDTLAIETVRSITGRHNYVDMTPRTDLSGAVVGVEKQKFDTLFTFLDLIIDPAYYADRPLVHVEYLPLRREFAQGAAPDDAAAQERWMTLTRLSPRVIATYLGVLQDRHSFELPYRKAFSALNEAMSLYESSASNLLLVAPPGPDAPYRHLATLAEDSPARRAAAALGAAWRAGDAAGVNGAVRTLAEELPRINAGVYPGFRRDLELAYNRSNAFEYGYWAYAVSLLALVLAFGTERKWLVAVGIGTLSAAVALHAFGFVTRCIIAERFAIQNQFESMTGLSLFANLVGVTIMAARRQWLFGAAAAGVGFLVLLTATQTGIPGLRIEREAAILNTSVLLKYHVTTVLCSYGLISLGFIISLFYLGTHYASKWRAAPVPLAAAALNLESGAPVGPARTLHDLDRAQLTVLQLAFWTLGVGILLGAWWADHSWGRWWAFDPKESWALATWIIYLIVIHLRLMTSRNRGLVTAWMSVLGFVVMCWTYFGVNLLLPGLHAYA